MNFTFSKYIISTICFCLFLLSDTLSQSKCCCGSPTELDFSGLDFEIDPAPPIGGVIVYFAVTNFGPWNLAQGAIDHDDKDYVPGLNSGNPNGPSNFIDLFGGGSGGAAGTIEYPLDGLTPGYTYIIEFYYATISTVGNFSANLKVANGAWLNVSWAASNSGYSIWLKGSYSFVAQSSTTTMSFKDTGASSPAYSVGVLLDDIKIFECPNNLGGPIVNNPPENLEVECDKDIPNIPKLAISDICDLNPSVSFKENTDIIDFCTKKITRQWIINDVCGNITNQKQIIDVIDKTPAQFLKYPENKIAYCNSNVIIEFNDWLKKNGDAIATDACGTVRWRHIFPRLPNTNCDSITVDFIAIDPCGNEIIESAYFLVKDTVAPIFISKPQDKNFIDNINIRDSLRSWLSTFGFSKTSSRCDTIIMSTDFDGDSTKNPIQVKFYVKDRCGNIDSATAIFSYQNSRVLCCCGAPRQLDFPGLDFEIDPFPPLNNYFYYTAFTTFGPWNVTQGTIDHGGAEYCGGLGVGNPNGQSHFIDLFGSPPTGSIAGTIEYPLYGLTPGYQYTIKFWYATFTSNGNFSANLKVANGSWLNVTWTANNPGAAVWLEKTYTFVAQATSANLSFTDTGSSSATYQIGMLLDDITIFECPTDLEKPVVTNPPDDYNVECDLDVPPVPILDITDNCDADPVITFRETKETFDPCTKKITRYWDIKDDCGNIQTEVQIINIIDQFPPEFTQLPKDTFAYCQQDVLKLFNDWIKQNGYAIASDACDVISWKSSFIREPVSSCDTVTVSFIATDHCGKESTESAKFIVRDTSAPRFILPAIDKAFSCIPNLRDSLRNWLQNFGYSSNASDCDTIIKTNNFDGDSTKIPIVVTFYAKDRCGNIDSSTARFSYRNGTDTFRITQFSCTFPGNSLDTMVFNSGGCDSVVISEKIRRSADSSYITTNSCDPKLNAFDTLRLQNQFGCDSFIFTHILIHHIDTSRQKIYDCNFTALVVDTAVFIGQFCDSIVLTEKIPLRKDSIFIQQSSCDSLDKGLKFLNLTNVFGCDSVVRINTTFSGVITQFISKNECGLIKNYTDTLVFSTSNCDSLVITNHIGLKIDTSLLQQSSCDLSKAGIDTLIYQTATCDSIVIVNTLFIPADTTFVQQTSCDLNQVGISTKLYNTSTCDSLVIINTQFIPSDTTRVNVTTCDISQVGIDSFFFATSTCDSLVITTTSFILSDTTRINLTSCDISQVGIDSTFFATSTCDSLVITTTSFKSSDTSLINQTTCLPSAAGLDTVQLQKSNGCDSLVITNTLFVPLRLQFKLDSITCHDKADAKISILNEQDFNKPYTVYLNQSNVGQQNQLTNLGSGKHQVYIKDQQGCITDSIEINLQNPDAFTTELGNEQLVNKGSQVQLLLQTNHNWQHIQWNPTGVIGCMDCNPVNFQINQDTWIYSLAIDEQNCESLDSVLIRVREDAKVFVPNSFSPNGDNINDYFYVQGDDQAVVELMQIFDRWGNQVFEARNVPVNDPLKGWNGKASDRHLNPGVFVYYIEIRNTPLEIKRIWGDLSLIR